MIYCPSCFNQTLALNPRGVVQVIINNKQMDAGRFLFNVQKEKEEVIFNNLVQKLDEFLRWYANFTNKEAVSEINICSSDFTCSQKCQLPLSLRISVIGHLFEEEAVLNKIKELSKRYNIPVDEKPLIQEDQN